MNKLLCLSAHAQIHAIIHAWGTGVVLIEFWCCQHLQARECRQKKAQTKCFSSCQATFWSFSWPNREINPLCRHWDCLLQGLLEQFINQVLAHNPRNSMFCTELLEPTTVNGTRISEPSQIFFKNLPLLSTYQ